MAGGNAISKRLDQLSDQWNEFATNADARLLRWLVRDDEYRMVEAFIQREQDDAAGEIPDLFLRFNEPFEDVNAYGIVLRDSLIAQYEAARAELEGEDIDMSWSPPPAGDQHSLLAFLAACISLHAHHADTLEKFALILTPVTITSETEWQRWLQALAERLPAEVRVAVIEAVDAPALEALAQVLPKRVLTTTADLDMPAAITALARAAGTSTPDGQFRVQFAAMAQALGKSDLQEAEKRANGALAVAKENDWHQLVAAVHMALAGAYLTAGRHDDAIQRYREADRAGAQLEKSGDDVGGKLRMQAGMGASGVLFAAGQHAPAAKAYAAAAGRAQASGDNLMALECWRMSSYCHEQTGDVAGAWDAGVKALEAGEAMPAEDRAHSTLAHAAAGLSRIAGESPTHITFIENRMRELLARPDWRALLQLPKAFT